MSLRIGITGGIGSGKTTICRIFSVLGIPVFDADAQAKQLMESDPGLVKQLIAHFGPDIFDGQGRLRRADLASKVFGNQSELDKLNRLVHPVVIQAGDAWAQSMADSGRFPYTIKEAALLFESGSYERNNYNILVTAPIEMRIQRVMRRDQASRAQIQARIDKQLPDQEKERLADFIIINDGRTPVIPQVLDLHTHFISLSSS